MRETTLLSRGTGSLSIREWKAILRLDPCVYCGGPGGTVDHIDPRHVAKGHRRSDVANLTGACEQCNRRKDKGKDGGHRSVLMSVLAAHDQAIVALHKQKFHEPGSWLAPGDHVAGPFFSKGVVTSIRPLLIDVPGRAEAWEVVNPAVLRKVAA